MAETVTFTFRVTGGGARLRFCVFEPTRTEILEVHVEGPQPQTTVLGGWTVLLRWKEPLAPGASVRVHVHYRGEGLRLLRSDWDGDVVWLQEFNVDLYHVSPLELQAGLQQWQTGQLQSSATQPLPDVPGIPGSGAYRAFFRDYDFQTNPVLMPTVLDPVEEAFRCMVIAATGEMLWSRVEVRAAQGFVPAAMGCVPAGTTAPVVPAAWIAYLSALQRGIAESQPQFLGIPPMPPGLRWDQLERAFELFAAGHLEDCVTFGYGAYPIPNLRPDSVNLFLFAEFAFLALELGCDTTYWQGLLNVLVRCQKIFMLTYPSLKPAPYWTLDPTMIGTIRADHAGLSQQELSISMQSNLAALQGLDKPYSVCPAPPPPPAPPVP